MDKYGFIYVWRDSKRNMYYVGCHWGREDDGYVCSSTRMRNAYNRRRGDFKRRVVQRVYISRNDLLEQEHKWLLQIADEQLGCKFYNVSKKHFGHWSCRDDAEVLSKKMGRYERTPEIRQKLAEIQKGKPSPTKGKKLSDETRLKMSLARKGKKFGPRGPYKKKTQHHD